MVDHLAMAAVLPLDSRNSGQDSDAPERCGHAEVGKQNVGEFCWEKMGSWFVAVSLPFFA